MHANVMHAQRGQAIVETAVFLPMFLLSLFGVIWAVQAAVQYERVESAVRYAGLISQRANPYEQYSFYSLYTQLGSTVMPPVACVFPLSAPLSDAAPTYTSTASPPFWTPTAGSAPGCAGPDSAAILGMPAGTGLTQDVILSEQYPSITASINVPTVLSGPLTSLSSTSASERFFAPVGINTILACYPTLNTQIDTSLNFKDDVAMATTPAQLPDTVTAVTLPPNSVCMTF